MHPGAYGGKYEVRGTGYEVGAPLIFSFLTPRTWHLTPCIWHPSPHFAFSFSPQIAVRLPPKRIIILQKQIHVINYCRNHGF